MTKAHLGNVLKLTALTPAWRYGGICYWTVPVGLMSVWVFMRACCSYCASCPLESRSDNLFLSCPCNLTDLFYFMLQLSLPFSCTFSCSLRTLTPSQSGLSVTCLTFTFLSFYTFLRADGHFWLSKKYQWVLLFKVHLVFVSATTSEAFTLMCKLSCWNVGRLHWNFFGSLIVFTWWRKVIKYLYSCTFH